MPGVGVQLAQKLARLGLNTPRDLLFHLPLRYQDRSRVSRIGSLQVGQEALVVGQVMLAAVHFGRRRNLLVRLSDNTGQLTLRFFHFNQSQQSGFSAQTWVQCYGEIRSGRGTLEMVHPEYRLSPQCPSTPTEATLTPVYASTEGVATNRIRRLVDAALQQELPKLAPLLPDSLAERFRLMPIATALQSVHRPPADADTAALLSGRHPSQQRLAVEELLAHHLSLYRLRQQRQAQQSPALTRASPSWSRLQRALAFELTAAQQRVVDEIQVDLAQATPTLRLVQGDVGSGKTVVAAAAALQAIDSGFQVALMAPTELLAEQHRTTFIDWFAPLALELTWLTGKLPAAQRRQALADIVTGHGQLVIGTHALFQDQVEFHRLGLVIIDEQHRFGVGQRLALRGKGDTEQQAPHQLIMSATPIPRSMAMLCYADLDVSSIDELPPGRLPVTTVAIPNNRRDQVAARVHTNCRKGYQAYWVCPLIEESDKLQAQAATETYQALCRALPDLRIDLIHGRLAAKQKDHVMQQFRAAATDLLVATSVIEVGVDVPNATLMVVENAERLGLAQLHQLRGRVGRGGEQAACVLLYQPPLGQLAKQRLTILRDTNDGFKVAELDLQQRGPGEMLGTRQTGLQQLKVADFHRDQHLLPSVERLACEIRQQCPQIIPSLIQRWLSEGEDYANV